MKLTPALREVHRSERALAAALTRVADRHRVEHEIFHMAHDLAGWSREHLETLSRIGAERGVRLGAAPRPSSAAAARLRRRTGELLGRRPEPGLLVAVDLRMLRLKATAVALDWDLVCQGAQVARDTDLLEAARRCRAETQRQIDWADTMLTELTPQILAQ